MIITDVSGHSTYPETSVSNETTPRNNQEEWDLVAVLNGHVDSDTCCDYLLANFANKAVGDNVLPEYVVNANNAVWPWGTAVMHDCCVALHPHPAAIFREEPEVLCRHLALEQNCKRSTLNIETYIKHRGHYTYHQFLRSAHTVHLCFMWIWEQTAIISLYSRHVKLRVTRGPYGPHSTCGPWAACLTCLT
jgi:hypothetical protein